MATMKDPLAIGTLYDGHRIVEVVCEEPDDEYQPFLYLLDNGETVWIPVTDDGGPRYQLA